MKLISKFPLWIKILLVLLSILLVLGIGFLVYAGIVFAGAENTGGDHAGFAVAGFFVILLFIILPPVIMIPALIYMGWQIVHKIKGYKALVSVIILILLIPLGLLAHAPLNEGIPNFFNELSGRDGNLMQVLPWVFCSWIFIGFFLYGLLSVNAEGDKKGIYLTQFKTAAVIFIVGLIVGKIFLFLAGLLAVGSLVNYVVYRRK